MECIHEGCVVHANIFPKNIVIANRFAKLCDFGPQVCLDKSLSSSLRGLAIGHFGNIDQTLIDAFHANIILY